MLDVNPKSKTEIRTCEVHGDYEAVLTKSFINEKWLGGRCPKCQDCADSKAQTKALKLKLIKQCNIPARFLGSRFDNYQVIHGHEQQLAFQTLTKYAEKFIDRLSKGGSLLLYGKCGTGKTHLACALANYVISHHRRPCMYVKVYDMLDSIKESWGNSLVNTEQVMLQFVKPDLLILDEVGIQFGSQSEEVLIFRVINMRYESIKPTIIISNLDDSGLNRFLGERIIDRLYENGGARVAFTWPSYRKRTELMNGSFLGVNLRGLASAKYR